MLGHTGLQVCRGIQYWMGSFRAPLIGLAAHYTAFYRFLNILGCKAGEQGVFASIEKRLQLLPTGCKLEMCIKANKWFQFVPGFALHPTPPAAARLNQALCAISNPLGLCFKKVV